MHSHLVTAFYDTLSKCFDKVVHQINPNFPATVYERLAMRGISRSEISEHFDNVMKVLNEWLGAGARIIGLQTLRELYNEYSTSLNFDRDTSVSDMIVFLRERVFALHLTPRNLIHVEVAPPLISK